MTKLSWIKLSDFGMKLYHHQTKDMQTGQVLNSVLITKRNKLKSMLEKRQSSLLDFNPLLREVLGV